MTWTIVWTDAVRKDIQDLPRAMRERVVRKVVEVSRGDAARSFRRLQGEPGWRLRVGDQRVIADLDVGKQTITVLAVGHRRNVYDR